MKTKKKSYYQSRIERLQIKSENESKTIKELLSPAAFEKYKKAQPALPQGTSCRHKLQDFNGLISKETISKAPQKQLKELVKKKLEKEGKKRKLSIWEKRKNDLKNTEVKALLGEIIETVEKGTEVQGISNKIENEAGKSQIAFQSWAFQAESKEVEPLNDCALEGQESYEPWEPKVELLEEEEDLQIPLLPNYIETQSGLKEDPKEMKELPISYISVEQLSGLVELQKKPDDTEEGPFQKQYFQLSAVPAEGMCGLVEIKQDPENVEEVPFSYFPVDQQSNFYVLY